MIKYSRQDWSQCECGDREELLNIFLYDLPNLTTCNVVPPLHILNIFLLRGWVGGGMSPKFMWQPFELSEQEYQEILPKLLNPNWAVLCQKLWRIRLPMKLDPEFDAIGDRYTWMALITEKHRVNSLAEAKKEMEQLKKENFDIIAEFQLSQLQHNNSLGID